MGFGEIARGLRDLKVYPITGSGLGTAVDWPGARSLQWSVDQDSEPLEGDDVVIANALDSGVGSASIETGRVSLATYAAVRGGTAVTAGDPGAQTITLEESASGGEDYVMIVGQAMSRDLAGSAYRVALHKSQVGSPNETLANKAYNTPTADVAFFENDAGEFITRIQYETAEAIPSTWT